MAPGDPSAGGAPGGAGGVASAAPGAGFGLAAPGATGGAGGSSTPVSFHYPNSAVTAFLDALKAKDKTKLAEATAKRASTEAEEKHRKIFSEILDSTISDDDLDEMSKALAGFKVTQVLPAKSTGRIGVLVGKQDGRDYLQRTIITRKEKDGWKVLDIANMYDYKSPMMGRGRGASGKGR
jgi:hypothetical protein